MKRKNLKFIIGSVLIIVVVVWIFGSISSQNMTYYYTPSEVLEQYDELKEDTIRVMGMVSPDSLKWIPRQTKLDFLISDESGSSLQVNYIGAIPDMLREGQGVVVEGKMSGVGQFEADNLLVKHNEEYTVTEHKTKKEDYYKTLEP